MVKELSDAIADHVGAKYLLIIVYNGHSGGYKHRFLLR